MKKTIPESDLKTIDEYRDNRYGYLVEQDYVPNQKTKWTARIFLCKNIAEAKTQRGGTLLFLDEANARNAFSYAEFGKILNALMLNSILPEMKYFREKNYEIIDDGEEKDK